MQNVIDLNANNKAHPTTIPMMMMLIWPNKTKITSQTEGVFRTTLFAGYGATQGFYSWQSIL